MLARADPDRDRAADLDFVTADGAEWIRTVVAERAPEAIVCIDTFHVVGWATDALDEVRRGEWNVLRHTGDAAADKAFKGLRWVLLRNWENLRGKQKEVIRSLEKANRRMFRAWQLKEELRGRTSQLRDIFKLGLGAARRALDDWLARASRSKLAPFVKLARTIRRYRESIEATPPAGDGAFAYRRQSLQKPLLSRPNGTRAAERVNERSRTSIRSASRAAVQSPGPGAGGAPGAGAGGAPGATT